MNIRLTLALIVLIPFLRPAQAEPPLLEVEIEGKRLIGKVLAHDGTDCWFQGRDGRLDELPMKDVTTFREIPGRFRKFSSADLRDQLLREFGRDYEVVGTSHYLVCAARGQAASYAQVFEDIYRGFQVYFSVRGFTIKEPEFPLMAIVFPTQARFAEYCRKDGVMPRRGLMGYYSRLTNRVAVFDDGDGTASAGEVRDQRSEVSNEYRLAATRQRSALAHAEMTCYANIDADLRGTIIHETTHQVAFNTGLHLRIGHNPLWVAEGLATVFEADGVRDTTPGLPVEQRVNLDRYVWFSNYARTRRPAKSLESFLSGDGLFQQATLDAYSQAWALTFYLVETRPSEYAKYLKLIAARDPLAEYTAEQRVADFRKAFGHDLTMLEADLLRFIARLQ